MAGIYIHIPFCAQKCAYCNYYSISVGAVHTSPPQVFVDALISEIILRKNECTEPIETVYFGGGTPSLLSINDLEKIFEVLQKTFVFAENAEITLEGNPESLSKNYVKNLRNYTPINRLSIGIQSFFEDDLRYLDRKHSPQQALEAVKNAQNAGFERLSIDLIYGIPTLTNKKWLDNLERFFSLGVSHLSAYSLTIEPHTALEEQILKNQTPAPTDEQLAHHYLLLREQSDRHGFEAYETSNFCKDKHYSRHNRNYWNHSKYYGFGPSAHSFSGTVRSWNVEDLDSYITSVKNGVLPSEAEVITEDMLYNEYVMTAIRTLWGISESELQNRFGERFLQHFQKSINTIPTDWIIYQSGNLTTTPKGALLADTIAGRLFV